MGLVVDSRILQEQAELPVETGFDLFAISGKSVRLFGEILAFLWCKDMLLKALNGRYPSRLTDECCHMINFRLDSGKNLNTGGAIADQTDMFALELHTAIPVRRMQQSTFIVLEARDCRPSPVVENTACVDEYVTMIMQIVTSSQILDRHIPARQVFIPICASDLMRTLDVLVKAVLMSKVVEVFKDLARASINGRPVELWLEGPGVVVTGHITSATWILGVC